MNKLAIGETKVDFTVCIHWANMWSMHGGIKTLEEAEADVEAALKSPWGIPEVEIIKHTTERIR